MNDGQRPTENGQRPALRIIDVTAGRRTIWLDTAHPDAVYVDVRPEVRPDVLADSTRLPFAAATFDLAIFDPPHKNVGATARMTSTYGHFTIAQIFSVCAAPPRKTEN